MSGRDARKAAVLMQSLPAEAARALLAQLSPAEAQTVRSAIACVGACREIERAETLKQFAADALAAESDAARSFGGLARLGAPYLAALLADEYPQTTALVLSRLPTRMAAEVLLALRSALRADVTRRIASLGDVCSDVLADVEREFAEHVAHFPVLRYEGIDGAATVDRILTAMDREAGQASTAAISGLTPSTATSAAQGSHPATPELRVA